MIFTEGRSTQIEELIKCCDRKVCKVKAETQIDSYGFCLSAIMQDPKLTENLIVVGDEHTYSYLSQVCKGKKIPAVVSTLWSNIESKHDYPLLRTRNGV